MFPHAPGLSRNERELRVKKSCKEAAELLLLRPNLNMIATGIARQESENKAYNHQMKEVNHGTISRR
jgi:hypothetical protein